MSRPNLGKVFVPLKVEMLGRPIWCCLECGSYRLSAMESISPAALLSSVGA